MGTGATVDCPRGAAFLSEEGAAASEPGWPLHSEIVRRVPDCEGAEWGRTGTQIGVLVDVNLGLNRCGVEGTVMWNWAARWLQLRDIQHVCDFAECCADATKAVEGAQ